MNPLRFAREFLGFEPDEPQARILEQVLDFHRIGWNCSRQWGKSTMPAAFGRERNSGFRLAGPTGAAGDRYGRVSCVAKLP